MNIKKCSCIMLCVAVMCAVLGIFSSFAGGSDAVFVNGYPMYPGDEIVVNIVMNKSDTLISAYSGTITYESKYLTPIDVTADYGNTVYNVELTDKFKFAAADGINGMDFTKDTTVISVKYMVNNETGVETDIGYKFDELYEFDKDSLTDKAIEDASTLSNMQIQFISNNEDDSEKESAAPTEDTSEKESATPSEDASEKESATPAEDTSVQESATPVQDNNGGDTVTPAQNNGNDDSASVEDNSTPAESIPTENKDTNNSGQTPSVNTDTSNSNQTPSVNTDTSSNQSSTSNNSSSETTGTRTGNPADSNSSIDNSSINGENIPTVVVNDDGDVVDDNSDYQITDDNNVLTGDSSSLKSKILLGLASLLGCGGVGGLIKSSKKTLYY